MDHHRIVITGLGLRTPLGSDPKTVFEALLRRESAFALNPTLDYPDLTHQKTAHVPSVGATPEQMRSTTLAIDAGKSALADAGLALGSENGGLFCNTLFGPPATHPEAFDNFGPHSPFLKLESHGARLAQIAEALQVKGPCRSFVDACAGNLALGDGLLALREGRLEWAMVGGTEEISAPAYIGFHQIRAISDACRPFAQNRTGLIMGEGAAFLILETLASAEKRGARIYAELLSCGSSNDAYDLVAPDPDGRGAEQAIQAALHFGGIAATQVDYINAHGTGTHLNDVAEAKAINRVFGSPESQPVTTSIKGNLGHAMGAASAIEAAITAYALVQQSIPPTCDLSEPDNDLQLRLEADDDAPIEVALSHSFGFGGANAVIAMATPQKTTPLHTTRPVYIQSASVSANGVLGIKSALKQIETGDAFECSHLEFDPRELLGRKGLRHTDRAALILGAAVATDLSTWPHHPPETCGGVLGVAQPSFNAGMTVLDKLQSGGVRAVNPGCVPHSTSNSAMSWLLMRLGITGYNCTLATGDCAGLDSIAHAASILQAEQADHLLAGGVAAFHPILWQSHQRTNLAEGVGLVTLSASPNQALCKIHETASSFAGQNPNLALQQAYEQLSGSVEIQWALSPHPAGLNLPEVEVVALEPTTGYCLAAGGAMAAAVGAHKVATTKAAGLICATSPEGFASVMLLTPTKEDAHE